MKASPSYTINDIAKAYIIARAAVRLQTGRKIMPFREVYQSPFTPSDLAGAVYRYARDYLPGLTRKRTMEVLKLALGVQGERAKMRPAPPGRLYPLRDYDAVAFTIWERRGRPKFGKRKVTGVRWGAGYVADNGRFGWDRAIRSRFLGVRLDGGRLTVVCPD